MTGCHRSGEQRFRRPESSFAAAIARGVVDKVHRFKAPQLKTGVVRRAAAIDPSCFTPPATGASLPLKSMASAKPATDWFSPSVANSSVPAADHTIMRHAVAIDDLKSVEAAWLGAWCSSKHCIIAKFPWLSDTQWWMALHHFDGSACLVWPVSLDATALSGGHILINIERAARPMLVAVLCLDGVVASTFEWKSWAWLRTRVAIGRNLKPGVRPCKLANTLEEPIINLMARNAWFSLPQTTIGDFLEYRGKECPRGASLFDVVFAGTKAILDLPDASVMEIMRVRFAKLPIHNEYLGSLLEVDEAQACLDEQDRKELVKVQHAHDHHTIERSEFVASFRKHRERIDAAEPKGAKRVKTAVVPQYKGPRKLPEPGKETISQKQLKPLCPPGAYIWVARRASAWMTRLPPFKEYPAPWRHYESEEAAAFDALADAWKKYLELEGLPMSACPISGLFAAPSGSASSSGG